MEENGSLGLYLSQDRAVAVWLSAGSESRVLHRMAIPFSEDEPETMALQAARSVMRQGFAFDEVFVAVDCGYYTQYVLQSEFDDYNQIAGTIKFDAEEAAATDAMNLAVTFEISGKNELGSEVTVFTADRQLMTDILLDVQEGGLDPTFIEPDAVCLVRAFAAISYFSEDTQTAYIVLGRSSCYLFRPKRDAAPVVRTFLIERGQDISSMLTREILLAVAASNEEDAVKTVTLVGNTDDVNIETLRQRTGVDVQVGNPAQKLDSSWVADDQMDSYEFMIAYGAALAVATRGHKADFRRDFMPYQGRKKMLEKSMKMISVSMTVLLLSLAIFFQLKAFRMKGYVDQLSQKALKEHKAVTYGKSPLRGQTVTSSLRRELGRAKSAAAGDVDEGVVTAKLTFLFEAINKSPKNVDINIQQITTTERSMKIKGDTNSRSATLAFLDQIKKHPQLKVGPARYTSDGNRDAFEISIDPVKK